MANIKLNSSSSTQDKKIYLTIELTTNASTLSLKQLKRIHTGKTARNDF